MPIRIPQVESRQTPDVGGGAMIPYSEAAVGALPLQQLAQAGHSFEKIGEDYARAQQKLLEQDSRIDMGNRLTELKDRLSQNDVQMAEEQVEPTALAQTTQTRGNQLVNELSGQLKYRNADPLFREKANELVTENVIRNRREGLQRVLDRTSAGADFQMSELANGVVETDESPYGLALRNQRLQDMRALASDMINGKAWGADHASAKLRENLDIASKGLILKQYNDPANRADTLNKLMAGTWDLGGYRMPIATQQEFGRTLAQRAKEEQRADEDYAWKTAERNSKVFESRFWNSFSTGKAEDRMGRPEFLAGVRQFEGHISPESTKAMRDAIDQPEKDGGTTNWGIYHDLKIRILTHSPDTTVDTITRQPIDSVAAKEKAELLKLLATMQKEDDISHNAFYKLGREQIMILLGGVPTGMPQMLGIPVLKPAESQKLSDTLVQFDTLARTEKYAKDPVLLRDLGAQLGKAGRGSIGETGMAPPSTQSAPKMSPGAPAPAPPPEPTKATPGAAPTTQPQSGAPKVELPRYGGEVKGSQKALFGKGKD
jgi:hypothetical protein